MSEINWDEVSRRNKEILDLRRQLSDAHRVVEALRRNALETQGKVERVLDAKDAALRKYGTHLDGCRARWKGRYPARFIKCKCGLAEALHPETEKGQPEKAGEKDAHLPHLMKSLLCAALLFLPTLAGAEGLPDSGIKAHCAVLHADGKCPNEIAEFKNVVVLGWPAPEPEVEWFGDSGARYVPNVDGRFIKLPEDIQVGLRSDGVVVWRKKGLVKP